MIWIYTVWIYTVYPGSVGQWLKPLKPCNHKKKIIRNHCRKRHVFKIMYEGPAKSYVTNRLSKFYPYIYQCLQQIPKENYLSAFLHWVKRLQKCVSVKGNTLKVCNKNMFDKT